MKLLPLEVTHTANLMVMRKTKQQTSMFCARAPPRVLTSYSSVAVC